MNKRFIGRLAVVPAALATGSAMAALPTGVATVFTDLGTDFAALLALAYPLFFAVVGGLVILGLVKKVVTKAAS